jgi:hypothetical protein
MEHFDEPIQNLFDEVHNLTQSLKYQFDIFGKENNINEYNNSFNSLLSDAHELANLLNNLLDQILKMTFVQQPGLELLVVTVKDADEVIEAIKILTK